MVDVFWRRRRRKRPNDIDDDGVCGVRVAQLLRFSARCGRFTRDEVRYFPVGDDFEGSGEVVEAEFVGELDQVDLVYAQFARVRARARESGETESF